MNEFSTGLFLISLDFELFWGVRDKRSIESYRENLENTRAAVLATVALFEKYEIHATWSTVGMLFQASRESLTGNPPSIRPSYQDENLCPYRYIDSADFLEPELHFAQDVIQTVARTPGQAIGSHTYSHFYCLEEGVTPDQFQADLQMARKVASNSVGPPESLVFPRNQWRKDFLPILRNSGFRSYRGVEDHWVYQATPNQKQGYLRRALRLLDAYFNLTGHHTFGPSACGHAKPYNLPASRFLRPYNKKLAFLDPLKRRRIVQSMKEAAKKRQALHLWWHPHNFGSHLKENLDFLESLLLKYQELKAEYELRSVSMEDLSRELAATQEA